MLAKPEPHTFIDFSTRFQQAQHLQREKKGVIFIGNTRAGKTTLSCAAAGANIKVYHNKKFQLTFLHPSDQPYKQKVKDSNQSVTEVPNFFRHHNLAIIDMPGYADSSRFKQLINFHYIRTMVSNLEQIRFFVVVTLSYADGIYQMQGVQKRMLQNFADTFPQSRDCVHIIINRVQHNNFGDNHKQIESIRTSFKNLLAENPKIKKYFDIIAPQRIHVLFRPLYKENISKTDWEEDYPFLTKHMQELCADKNANFHTIKNFKTKVNIFKEGDNTENEKFRDLLKMILKQEQRRAKKVIQSCQLIIFFLIKGSVQHKLHNQEEQIYQILHNFMQEDIKIKRPHERTINIDSLNVNFSLIQSRLIKLFFNMSEIYYSQQNYLKNSTERENYILTTINKLIGQLTWIIQSVYPDNKILLKNMKNLHVYMMRRLEESFFIQKTLVNQNILDTIELQEFIQINIYQLPNQFNKFEKISDSIIQNFQKLVEEVLSLNLKLRFSNNFSEQIKRELLQTLENINFLNQKGVITRENDKINKLREKIAKKIAEVQMYHLLIFVPNRAEEIKTYIEKLLSCYHKIPNKENKYKIAIKIATNLAKRQPKHAIALFLHLDIYQEAMRNLELLIDPKKNQPKKNEVQLKWYLQLADFFKNKKKPYYFQRSIEKAKTLCMEDYQMLVNLQKMQEQGLQNMSQLPKKDLSLLKASNLADKLQFWQWQKIDEEIEFLKMLYKLENKKKDFKVIGSKLRQ